MPLTVQTPSYWTQVSTNVILLAKTAQSLQNTNKTGNKTHLVNEMLTGIVRTQLALDRS